MKTSIFALAAVATAGSIASADLVVTEAFAGLPGEDGTVDWIEVTNTGVGVIDTGGFWYDDDSADITKAGNLDSFVLGAGQSAIFLLDSDPKDDVTYATAMDEFMAIWGSVSFIGHTNGGGGLGQGADAAVLMLGDGTAVDTLAYAAAGSLSTIEKVGGLVRESVLGENGAYESAMFFNDNIGPVPDFMVSLVGSPGLVPTPGALALLAIGGLVGVRRRR